MNDLFILAVKIKAAGNSIGLTDNQIGELEICETHGDRTCFIPVDFVIEMAQSKRRGSIMKNNFVHLEFTNKKGIMIAKSLK